MLEHVHRGARRHLPVPALVVSGLLLVLTACGQSGSGDHAAQASSASRAQSSTATVSPPQTREHRARHHARPQTGHRRMATDTTLTSASPRTRARAAAGPSRDVTKMLVFVVENHSLSQMRSGMPYLYGLGQKYGYTTAYHALTHPSLPNYLGMTGGSTYGVSDDKDPSAHKVRAASVFGQARAVGKTAKVYAEGMPSNCATSNYGRYAVRHNPWTYHVTERRKCRKLDVPLSAYAGDVAAGRLPNAGMVVPDVCSDAHNCSLGTADAWLQKQIDLAMSGPDWKSGHLLIVVTADEDDHHEGNLVLTVLAHPYLDGAVVGTSLNHYSLARAYSEIDGATPLRSAKGATSLLGAFGLRAAP